MPTHATSPPEYIHHPVEPYVYEPVSNKPTGVVIDSKRGIGVTHGGGGGGGSHNVPVAPITPKPPVNIPKPMKKRYAVYLEERGGYVTSEGEFFPYKPQPIGLQKGTPIYSSWFPKGYSQGFADIRTTKQGETITVIPKEAVPFAKSTKEGVEVVRPSKPLFSDVGKSYNPKEFVDLGGGLVLKIPQPKSQPKKETFFQSYWKSQKHVFNVFTGGELVLKIPQPKSQPKKETFFQSYWKSQKHVFNVFTGGEYGIPTIIRIGEGVARTTVYSSQLLLPKPIKLLQEKAIGKYKFYDIFKTKPSVSDLLYTASVLPFGRIVSVASKSKNVFIAEVKPISLAEGEFTEVSLISASKVGGKGYIGLSNTLLREFGTGTSAGISRDILISSGKKGVIDIQDFLSVGGLKDIGKAKYVSNKKGFSVFAEIGEGQVSKSFSKEVRAMNIRNVLNMVTGKIMTVRQPLKVSKIYKVEGLRSTNLIGIEESTIGGFYKETALEGVYSYRGSTAPLLRIYKTGKRSIVLRGLNIKGIIKTGSVETKDYFGTTLRSGTLRSGKVTPKVKQQIEKSLSSLFMATTKKQESRMITTQISKRAITGTMSLAKSESLFYGKGQYELTSGGLTPQTFRRSQLLIGTQSFVDRQLFRTSLLNIPRESQTNRYRSRLGLGQPLSLAERQITRQLFKLNNQQSLKQRQRLIFSSKQVNKPLFKFNFKPVFTPIPPPPIKFKLRFKGQKQYKNIFGYRTFYTKKGKTIFLGGIREKGQAIRFGETFVTKNLRATFGVKRTSRLIKGTQTTFKPSSYLFRTYKIKKGRAIPLIDTFIQRRGKRLKFAGELKELQAFRRMKL